MEESAAYAREIDAAAARLLVAADSAEQPRDALLTALAEICVEALAEEKNGGRGLKQSLLAPSEKKRLDQILRSAVMQLVAGSVAADAPLMHWRAVGGGGPSTLQRLLELLLSVCEEPTFDSGLVLNLAENAMESSSVNECEEIFLWLEANMEAFRTPRMQHAKTSALRTGNNILRRLSKGRNATLCGRVFLFLSNLLPVDDRSGLRLTLKGDVSQNVTLIEDAAEVTVDSNGQPVDKVFYHRFWSLQQAFQRPEEHMDPAPWSAAVSCIAEVLQHFSKEEATSGNAQLQADGEEGGSDVKYLSSSRLLALQLRDAAFRQDFMLQVLVFLQSVRILSKGVSKSLKPKQEEEAERLEAATYKVLESTPEDGHSFAKAVRAIMSDEAHWVAWKKTVGGVKKIACASFVLPPYTFAADVKSRVTLPGGRPPRVMEQSRKRKSMEAATVGVSIDGGPLDDLWNQASNNLAGLDANKRQHCPTVHDFYEPLIGQMFPDAGVDEDFMLKSNPVFQWQALRKAARANMGVFAKAAASGRIEDAARGLFPLECPPAIEPLPAVAATDGIAEVADGPSVGVSSVNPGEEIHSDALPAGDVKDGTAHGDSEANGHPVELEPSATNEVVAMEA